MSRTTIYFCLTCLTILRVKGQNDTNEQTSNTFASSTELPATTITPDPGAISATDVGSTIATEPIQDSLTTMASSLDTPTLVATTADTGATYPSSPDTPSIPPLAPSTDKATSITMADTDATHSSPPEMPPASNIVPSNDATISTTAAGTSTPNPSSPSTPFISTIPPSYDATTSINETDTVSDTGTTKTALTPGKQEGRKVTPAPGAQATTDSNAEATTGPSAETTTSPSAQATTGPSAEGTGSSAESTTGSAAETTTGPSAQNGSDPTGGTTSGPSGEAAGKPTVKTPTGGAAPGSNQPPDQMKLPEISLRSEKNVSAQELEWAADKDTNWIHKYLRSLTRRFPKTTRLVEVGRSRGDLPIYAIEMSHKMRSGATIVLDAGMEATDRVGVSFSIFVLHQLIERLNENLLTLSGVKIVVVPLVNPDNYKKSLEGVDVEPCRGTFFRNFDVGTALNTAGCPAGFFTEPETKALSAYYTKLSKLKLYINIESSTPLISYPYGYRAGISRKSSSMAENVKNVIESKEVVGKVIMNNLNGYFGNFPGTPVDWFYNTLNVRYSLYMCLARGDSYYEKLRMMYAYFEAIRYAVLEIQLTDADVAQAIYQDFDSSNSIYANVTLLICLLLTFIYTY